MHFAPIDLSPLHVVHLLADHPVLASLAQERTAATRLDGRACRYLYEAALPRLDWQALSDSELAFMRSLGIEFRP